MEQEKLASTWLEYHLSGEEKDFWAVEELQSLAACNFEEAWKVIRAINAIKVNDPHWEEFIDGCLAAGPLEDLIVKFGDKLIHQIELESQKNPKLRKQLGLIYKRNISDDLWERILKLRTTQ